MTCGPGSPGTPRPPWWPGSRRCGPAPATSAGYATRVALRELGRRAEFLDGQLERLDELIVPLVTARAPGLLALYGVGPDTAALLLIAAGDHPGRLRSEAAWAHLCAAAPIPASSGKSPATGSTPAATARPTMPCGGSCSPGWARTRPPAPTSNAAPEEGKSKAEIIRCLKRYVAREVYPHLRPAAG